MFSERQSFYIFGRSKITFIAYDYFDTYPFSKFAVTYNGKLYDVNGSLIGSLSEETLQSLQPGHKHFQACFITQLTYVLNREDND